MPPIVSEYARVVLNQNLDEVTRERLIRLTSDLEMDSVWRTLSAFRVDPPVLREYIRIATLSGYLNPEKGFDSPSPATERRAFRKIAKSLREIQKELAELDKPRLDAAAGLSRLLHAVRRAELEAAKSRPRELPGLASLRLRLEDMKGRVGLKNLLETFLNAAETAADAPPSPGPRKKRAASARRTAYIQDLAGFLRHHFKKPLYAVVATTVNVALNEYKNPITPDHVRKLVTPARKIVSKKTK